MKAAIAGQIALTYDGSPHPVDWTIITQRRLRRSSDRFRQESARPIALLLLS